jgi:uncharacterized protein (DUF2062 family)
MSQRRKARRAPLLKRLRYALRVILSSHHSPQQIAAGAALGMFIAFTPTLGFQTILVVLLATMFRVSRIPAIIMVYVTNVFTAVPIYGACYLLGGRVCELFGMPPVRWETFESFAKALRQGSEMGAIEFIGHISMTFAVLGIKIALPLWVGGVIVGLICTVITYAIILRLVEGHRVLQAQRLARRLKKKVHSEADAPDGATETPQHADVRPRDDKDAAHEYDATEEGRTGTHRVDTSAESDAAGGHRRSG